MLSVMGVWGQTGECFRRLVLSKAGVHGPPLDPSILLRMSGPTLLDSGSGGGMTPLEKLLDGF